MTASTKKRPRSPQNDCEECLPISKRINRLQIQPGRQMNFDGANTLQVPFRANSIPEDLNAQCRNMRIHSDPLTPTDQLISANHSISQYGPSTSTISSSGSISTNSLNCNSCDTPNANNLFLQYEDEKNYEPELNQTDNPHYFTINKLLFEAHVDRVDRIRTKFTDS